MSKELSSVISQLEKKFNGEASHDIDIVRQYISTLEQTPEALHLISGLGHFIYRTYPNADTAQMSDSLGRAIEAFHEKLSAGQKLASEKRFEEAEVIYREILGDIDISDIEDARTLSFNHAFEEMIFRAHDKDERPIKRISNLPQIVMYQYGTILVELSQLDKAKEVLANCQKLNPVDVKPIFELAEIAKMASDLDELNRLMSVAYSRIFTRKGLARYYRNASIIATMREQYRLATALTYISLDYEDSPIARATLNSLAKVQGADLSKPSVDEVKKLISDTDFGLGPCGDIVDLALHIGQTTRDIQPTISHMAFSIAYDLTHYKPLLKELRRG